MERAARAPLHVVIDYRARNRVRFRNIWIRPLDDKSFLFARPKETGRAE